MKNNDRFCTSCKQVGHKEHECKNKIKSANVSSIKINSFYLLTKGTNGVKAKFIGTPWMGSKKKAICNEDIPSIHSSPNEATLDIAGPITRSRAKQLEKEIHSQVNANLMLNNQIMLNGPMLEYLFQCS